MARVPIWRVQSFFDLDDDGSCPCFEADIKIDGEKVKIWGRCWRVSKNAQDLIITTTLPTEKAQLIGEAIKKKLDKQEWYNPYTVIIKKR